MALPGLFRNDRIKLTTIVKEIGANASCERYIVVTKFTGTWITPTKAFEIGVMKSGSLGGTSLFANID